MGRRDQLIGRIGLAALELLDRDRASETGDIELHPAGERGHIKAKALADLGRARILSSTCAHAPNASLCSRLIFFASDHLWTSVGPS